MLKDTFVDEQEWPNTVKVAPRADRMLTSSVRLDSTSDSAMAKAPSGRPSLINAPASTDAMAGARSPSMRVLDELESGKRAAPIRAPRRGYAWVAALTLIVAAGAAYLWRGGQAPRDPAPLPVAGSVGTTSTTTKAAAPAENPTGPARISTIELPAVAVVPLMPTAPQTAPAAVVARSMTPAAAGAARNPTTPRKSAVASAASASAASAARGGDSDVALLTAMLAHMSSDPDLAAKGTTGAQAQLTIAQLVKRCTQPGAADVIEAFECRRRICDGYWGKAEACPMSLAPKKL